MIPTTIPIPAWFHPLIEEVTALRHQALDGSNYEQTIRMALHAGLLADREMLRMIIENTKEAA